MSLSQLRDEPSSETISEKIQKQEEMIMVAGIIVERLLQAAINKSVSEKLNGLIREYDDFIKKDAGMSKNEEKEAGLQIYKMMKIATNNFFVKMDERIKPSV